MYYNDEYFVKYYNDPVFAQPPVRFSKHAVQRQNERIPKTHIGEKNVNIIKNNTVVTTITKSKKEYPIQDKLEQYLYHNKVEFDKDLIGRVIGKKGSNIKTLIYKVKCLVYSSNFDYYIDRTIIDNKHNIYILANNKDILSIATNELNSNIANICNTNNKK
tara:strand:- start:10148 stop:10630 length:483 start_codon:yes stop_codon:yes gene_type:complete